MSELKVGFIGFGNMAQAMAEGFLRTGALKPEQVYACARNWEKLCRNTEERGVHACRDAKEVADSANLVILAVKPYMIQEVTAPIREKLKDKIVVSVAAGYPFEKLEQALLPGTHHREHLSQYAGGGSRRNYRLRGQAFADRRRISDGQRPV